jgi:nucleotide-binding universal stress UspA family protein
MYNRILVPTNGSVLATQALRAAERLANRWNCELHVLTLVEGNKVESKIRESVESQVAGIRRRAKIEVKPVSNTVPDDIAFESDRVKDTLIVMGTRGRGRSAGVSSNMSEEVLRSVNRPMIVLGTAASIASDWPRGPMLIATDGSEFGEAGFQTAAKLAKAMAVEPRVVTVTDLSAVSDGVGSGAETDALRGLAGLVEGVTGRQVQYDILHSSDPAREIADFALRRQASSIAMSTHGRSGMARVAFGSVAMDVVRNAPCPVILNRPVLADSS